MEKNVRTELKYEKAVDWEPYGVDNIKEIRFDI